jgi:hypothetical protein
MGNTPFDWANGSPIRGSIARMSHFEAERQDVLVGTECSYKIRMEVTRPYSSPWSALYIYIPAPSSCVYTSAGVTLPSPHAQTQMHFPQSPRLGGPPQYAH